MQKTPALAASLAVCLVLLVPASGLDGPVVTRDQVRPFVSTLERMVPGAFDPARPARRGARARYRADAQILLPLLVTSIRIASRTGVGMASTEVRDLTLATGERILAYEFYSASIPERARGLDRLGFFREAVMGSNDSNRRTAYFGAMSVSKEQTLDEAKRAIERTPDLAPYDVIDGLASGETATSTSYSITLAGREPTAAAFFDRAYAAVDPAGGRPKPQVKAPPSRPLGGYSFLGAFETLLQAAASSPERARGLSRSFVFGGEQRTVEVRDVDPDASRGRAWAATGFVTRSAAVRRVECRITAPSWKVDFVVWIELPAAASANPAPFIVPLRVEYQPRAFLRLVLEREN